MNINNNYQENLLRLRSEVQKAVSLGTINAELYAQQVIQVLNATESLKQKAQSEIETLKSQIGQCEGKIRAANEFAALLINVVEAYNRQEIKRLEELKRVEQEKLEREAAIKSKETESQPTEIVETSKKRGRKSSAE